MPVGPPPGPPGPPPGGGSVGPAAAPSTQPIKVDVAAAPVLMVTGTPAASLLNGVMALFVTPLSSVLPTIGLAVPSV